jgi:hypothetical protein
VPAQATAALDDGEGHVREQADEQLVGRGLASLGRNANCWVEIRSRAMWSRIGHAMRVLSSMWPAAAPPQGTAKPGAAPGATMRRRNPLDPPIRRD